MSYCAEEVSENGAREMTSQLQSEYVLHCFVLTLTVDFTVFQSLALLITILLETFHCYQP